MNATSLLVPTFVQLLRALSNWLDKAQAQLGPAEAEVLLSARLAPDMFPLSSQIRFACVQAWEASHRLRAETFPAVVQVLLDEGREGGERPGTFSEAGMRIAETIAFLEQLAPDALDGEASRPIAHDLPMGIIFDLTADQYARDWAMPQFYFHLVTAYAILRGEGVNLGKADYVNHMFAHVRPGTLPTG